MSLNQSTKPETTSRPRDALSAVRQYLGNRTALLLLALVVVVAGLALNWSWLVAVGMAPILLATLPCLLMCAFGVCVVCMTRRL